MYSEALRTVFSLVYVCHLPRRGHMGILEDRGTRSFSWCHFMWLGDFPLCPLIALQEMREVMGHSSEAVWYRSKDAGNSEP